MKVQKTIPIKTPREIQILREAGRILGGIMGKVERSLKSGMTTKDVDQIVEDLIRESGTKPAFKGYRGFPACACISVNEEVVHGIPNNRVLKDGDIISVDAGIIYDGYYSDTAFTAPVGEISDDLKKLLRVADESLELGIAQAKVGNHLSDISWAIQRHVESQGLAIVKDFVGHGIGANLHEEPEIPNYGPPNMGPVLKEGMVFAIEPMVNLGTWKTRILEDGWTVVTQDRKCSAHTEHSVAILESGPEILTLR